MKQQRSHALRDASVGLILGLALAAPARAQDDVMRDVYRFQGSALEVDVSTDLPGRLRMVRGQRSRIEVSGRAPDGFTSAALGGTGVRRLALTSMGGERVDFVVVVPEDVRVRVNWLGSNRSELFGPLSDHAVYDWDSPIGRPAFETIRPEGTPAAGIRRVATPSLIDIADPQRVERLTIRVGSDPFDIDGAARLEPGADAIVVRPGRSGALTIRVPEDAETTIALDGRTALIIDGSGVHPACDAITAQTLPDGSRWFTLSPASGQCGASLDEDERPAAVHRRT